MAEKRVYGIDLGTTYSCVAVMNDLDIADVLFNSEGDQTTPSVVYFESEDSVVVGKIAKEEALLEPDQVVSTVKRQMGNADWSFSVLGKEYDATAISAIILRKLVEDVQAQIEDPITDVVITVPAYFGAERREATAQAGKAAGLNVRRIISEPTAAALSYGYGKDAQETVLIYDLGGGTFDTTVITCDKGKIDVVATDGDHELGGKNWDERLATHIAERFAEETGTPVNELYDTPETWQDIMNQAENLKRALSKKQNGKVTLRHEGLAHTPEVTREEFVSMTADLLERTVVKTRNSIDDAAKKGVTKIDRILMVGGSSFMPAVIERLEREFDMPVKLHEPNQSVAKGAAIFGHMLLVDEKIADRLTAMGESDETATPETRQQAKADVAADLGMSLSAINTADEGNLTDVSPKTFGIVVVDVDRDNPARKFVSNLIMRNQSVPASETRQFYTVGDDQSSVLLECVEWQSEAKDGEDPEPFDPTFKLGEAEFDLGGKKPKGHPFELTLGLTDDGRVTVSAIDKSSGQSVSAEWRAKGLRTEAEMKALQDDISGIRIGD